MQQETKNAMEALGMNAGSEGGKTDPGGGEIDWKAKFEETQRQLASARVEEGRVKKLDGELKAAQQRIAELEKKSVLDTLPESLSDAPELEKELSMHVAKGVFAKEITERDARMARMEKEIEEDKARRQAEMSQSFVARINRDFPGFASGLKEGGALKTAWDEYQTFNAASIKEAFATLNYDVLAYHIKRFYEAHGVDPSGGRGVDTPPDPRSTGGGAPRQTAGNAKTYTMQEYETLQQKAHSLRDEYRFDEYRKLARELEEAWTEGRVKQ